MKIIVNAKPNRKKAFVKMISPTEYIVSVHEPAQQSKANRAIIKALTSYFHLKTSEVLLLSGGTLEKKYLRFPWKKNNCHNLIKQR